MASLDRSQLYSTLRRKLSLMSRVERGVAADALARLFISVGEQVVTTGGLVGTVTHIDPSTLTLRVGPDGLRMQVKATYIAEIIPTEETNEEVS